MLATVPAPRNPSARACSFRSPPWHDLHPDFLRIDRALPLDHPARWLATVVARLDLSAFRRAYKGYGSFPYPVELLLPFVLFMYSEGNLSPARWAREARFNDPSKWLLRGLLPSRSLLYNFRDRIEPFLDDLHRQLIAWAIAEGVTTATRASLDGTFIAALASRHQLLNEARLDRRLLLLRLLVWLERGQDESLAVRLDRLPELLAAAAAVSWVELNCGLATPVTATFRGLATLLELLASPGTPHGPVRLPAWVPATPSGRARVLRRCEDARRRLTQRLQPLRQKKKLAKKDEQTLKRAKVSLTDPEAALGWDKLGTYRPLYNLLLVQATDAPLTLAFDVLARNNDDGLLRPMLQKTHAQLGRHLDEVLVDGAFVCVLDVAWCEQHEITVYAPPARAAAAGVGPGDAAGQKPAQSPKGGAKKPAKLPKSAFRYDAAERVYHCPEGKRLVEVSRTTTPRSGGLELPVIVHRAAGADCQQCARQQECTSNAAAGRVVKRYVGEEALERLAERMGEESAKEVYKLRKQTVELGYAELKEHRGLREFRCFGIQRARAQAGLVILASNGLKLMRILQKRQDHQPQPEKRSA